jgi:PadR family transcriptional regulator PadR
VVRLPRWNKKTGPQRVGVGSRQGPLEVQKDRFHSPLDSQRPRAPRTGWAEHLTVAREDKIILTISPDNNYIAVIMLPPVSLGEFEQVVLLAVLRLGENAYGVTIRNEIAECTGREPAPGALYTTLDRMEAKGLVKSRLGDPTPQRGGRAKRYMKVTKRGLAAVVSVQRSYQSLLQGLDLLGNANG